jgi:glycerate dehydrogenase
MPIKRKEWFMKIVILDGYTVNPGDLSWEGFECLGEVVVYDRTDFHQITTRIGHAEVVIVNKVPITEKIMNICSNIKYIGVLATGYDIVDVPAAKRRGIIVTNVPAYGTAAVAQHTIALLLEICHHVWDHSESVKRGDWARRLDWCFWNYPLIELAGMTLGIIGFGRVGQAVSSIAKSLGMNVLVYEAQVEGVKESKGNQYVTLNEILEKSDVISLHCPLLESTRGIINRASINKMKDGVILLNTSRGPLIIEKDLAEALNNGKIFSAAIDVASTEPISQNNPLLNARNCIITPHIAWAPRGSRSRLMDIAVENLKAYLGGNAINVVD